MIYLIQKRGDGGLIKTILLIIIALLILSYFGISLRQVATSPAGQDNFSYVGSQIAYVWNTYLKAPVTYIWSQFIYPIIISSFNNLIHLLNNQPNASPSSPQLPTPYPVTS